jgi:hypothetical protein
VLVLAQLQEFVQLLGEQLGEQLGLQRRLGESV